MLRISAPRSAAGALKDEYNQWRTFDPHVSAVGYEESVYVKLYSVGGRLESTMDPTLVIAKEDGELRHLKVGTDAGVALDTRPGFAVFAFNPRNGAGAGSFFASSKPWSIPGASLHQPTAKAPRAVRSEPAFTTPEVV